MALAKVCVAADLMELFKERQKSVVAIEFFVQLEIERQSYLAVGAVFDEEGRIVMLENSVPSWLPPERFKDFKVRPLGEDTEGYKGFYLGQDYLTGYHYLQVEEKARSQFKSITEFGHREGEIGEFLWGIGIMAKSWDYQPYFLSGRLSMVSQLPWEIGFADAALGRPGSVVFDENGQFVGWLGGSATKEYTIFMSGDRFNVALQTNRESTVFLMAEPFFKYVNRVPSNVEGDSRPWIGVSGLQPIDREVAKFLGLEEQGALVVSNVIEDSPAEQGGLEGKDIIVALGGERLKKFKPDFVLPRHFERWVMERNIGEAFSITVIRGEEEKELSITPTVEPLPLRKAQREYFEKLGVAIREFTLFDGISRRIMKTTSEGVISEFVKPNSPVNAADLQSGDWIKEIDGNKIETYEQAAEILAQIEKDTSRKDFVILISRNNETKVLRVKLT